MSVAAAPPAGAPRDGWVQALFRLAARTFYRLERVGGPLPEGGLLLVANHPNTLLDPAVILATAGRTVRFLARSTLFRGHVMSPFIRQSGALPVYRQVDADTSRNVEVFAAVEAALAAGEAICLFPEGQSHSRGRLDPLRTGAARMALAAAAAGHTVTVVPIGLNFEHVARFRSRAVAAYGRPVDLADCAALHASDAPAAVRRLTERIGERLRRVMVEADPRRDLPRVMRIERLYATARDVGREPWRELARRRKLAEGMARLREEDPERLADILARIDDYDAALARFGLDDHDLDRRMPRAAALRLALREGLLALLLAPVALASMVLFAPPYWLTGRANRWVAGRRMRAAWQVAGGAVVYSAWIGAAAVAVGGQAGAAAGGLAAAGLVALAFGGLRAVEREAAVVRTLRAFRALRQTPLAARAALRRQRADLAAVLDQTQEWLDAAESPGAAAEAAQAGSADAAAAEEAGETAPGRRDGARGGQN